MPAGAPTRLADQRCLTSLSITNLLLVLTAAALHAGWNYMAKSSRDTVTFLWWGVTLGAVGCCIYLLLTSGIYLPPEVWPYFIISDLAELAYFVTLVRGYSQGDLSLVYPLSRGSAPIFLAFWSALLLGERLPLLGYAGILLMVGGIYVSSLTVTAGQTLGVSKNPKGLIYNSAALWALASGVFVSVYSLSDKLVVAQMPPLVYNFWVYAGNAITWLPLVLLRRGPARMAEELRVNWPRVLAGSVMTVGAYVLVLVALTTSIASYVVAGRGTSVIIGAVLGWLALGEGFGRTRVLGAILMVIGLAVMTFAR